MTGPREIPPVMGRMLSLLREPPGSPDVSEGFIDLLGDRAEGRRSIAQSLMRSRVIPEVYERWWRPVLGQLAKAGGPSMADEVDIAVAHLGLGPGDVVLDIACGPGTFARRYAEVVGADGLVIGLDASTTMLQRAVRDTTAENVGYLRGDAVDLPLATDSLDAVSCYAALHLFSEPFTALDRMTDVLAPGGRIALLTSCARGPGLVREVSGLLAGVTGMRLFGADEVTGALTVRGFTDVRQRVSGVLQFVAGTLETAAA
ncbi:MAG: class I SAM-dependent methyltransferase [Micromonosporaceae bacterium]